MRNRYRIVENVVLIELNRNDGSPSHAIVSIEDLPKLLSFDCTWGELRTPYGSYVVGYKAGSGRNSNKVRLHRFLTDCPDNMVVDHINGNGLDNRRENLRICSQLENMQNITKPGRGIYSKERGVSFHKPTGRWTACCYAMKKKIFVGYFKTEEDAITAIREARARHKQQETEVSA